MNVHATGFFTAAECFDDLRPNRTRRAEFRYLHEEVLTHRELEHDKFRRLIGRGAALEHRTHVSDGGRKGISDLLNIIGSAVDVGITLDQKSFELGRVVHDPLADACRFVIEFIERLIELAVGDELTDRIGADEALERFEIAAVLLDGSRDQRKDRSGGLTGVDVQRILIEFQAFQKGLDIVKGRQADADIADFFRVFDGLSVERRGIELDVVNGRALIDLVLKERIVLVGHGLIAGLRNAPRLIDIAVDARAAKIIFHAGE